MIPLPNPDQTPYRMDNWPRSCGFSLDRSLTWRKGDLWLTREGPKVWRVHSGPDDHKGRIFQTRAKLPHVIAADLAARLRELTEAR